MTFFPLWSKTFTLGPLQPRPGVCPPVLGKSSCLLCYTLSWVFVVSSSQNSWEREDVNRFYEISLASLRAINSEGFITLVTHRTNFAWTHLSKPKQNFLYSYLFVPTRVFPGGSVVKNVPHNTMRLRRCEFDPWVRKVPWRRKWQSTPVFLPEKSHEQRILEGCRPRGSKRVGPDQATEHTHTHESKIISCARFLWARNCRF